MKRFPSVTVLAIALAITLAVAPAVALVAAAPLSTATAALVAQPATTTTTTLPTTTTSTTAPPPTTTTTVPVTTTSHPARTTTTVPATTTTTKPATTTTSSSTPWGLIALVIVLVVLIVLVALLMRSRAKRVRETEWRRTAVPALSDAQLARESLLSGNATADDPELRGAVSAQVERAAGALDSAGRNAPDEAAASTANSAAGALRGLAFAVEADRLLRQGATAPTGVQLAQADQARRDRTNELNTALARLSARIGSASGSPSRR